MPIALPDLPYDYDALQPVISAATMKMHHGAHHRGYVDKLNALVKIAEGDCANLGDISTLADPAVVDGLIRERQAGSAPENAPA